MTASPEQPPAGTQPDDSAPDSAPDSSPDSPPTSGDAVVDALNAALAGEHAAVYAYGVIGATVSQDDQARAAAELEWHRTARDTVTEQVLAAGGNPVASLPAYVTPFPVDDATTASDLADLVETRLAALYADVVTATTEDLRSGAVSAMVHGARARAEWAGTVTAFPGLDDRLTLDP